jgi:hypothetical protein
VKTHVRNLIRGVTTRRQGIHSHDPVPAEGGNMTDERKLTDDEILTTGTGASRSRMETADADGDDTDTTDGDDTDADADLEDPS